MQRGSPGSPRGVTNVSCEFLVVSLRLPQGYVPPQSGNISFLAPKCILTLCTFTCLTSSYCSFQWNHAMVVELTSQLPPFFCLELQLDLSFLMQPGLTALPRLKPFRGPAALNRKSSLLFMTKHLPRPEPTCFSIPASSWPARCSCHLATITFLRLY